MEINLANQAGRDAVVSAESVRSASKVRWLDKRGRQASSVRILKAPLERDASALLEKFGDIDNVGKALIDDDPEVDMENTGRMLRDTSRIYVDPQGRMKHKAQQWEVIRNPDGSERDRRPRKLPEQNVNADTPLKWSGVYVKKEQAIRRFVFVATQQLIHVNGLTYDFLYDMSSELEKRESLLMLGAGPKSKAPLILRRGGSPYRGFLEGRTQDDKYCLLLHFSNLELKAPVEATESE